MKQQYVVARSDVGEAMLSCGERRVVHVIMVKAYIRRHPSVVLAQLWCA